MSPLSGDVIKKIRIPQDEARGPCLLPGGRKALYSALKEGVSDIYEIDLETGESKNLTDDTFYDSDPQVSPDGKLVVYSRRVSGFEKIYAFALADPRRKTQLSFGTHNDVTPTFSRAASACTTSRTRTTTSSTCAAST
jgi:TolB protein